jgi:hypothetical protein
MKLFIISLPALLFLCLSLTGQDKSEFDPPKNVRNASDFLPNLVDLMWTPPEGWVPSPVDRWYYYDRGIYGGNAIGSCPGCPVEVAIRWDAFNFNYYDELYVSKIRYVLKEPALDYALRVYQVEDNIFDTSLNFPLQGDLVYNRFDTMSFMPIPVDVSKELWVGLWVSDMGPGYPLAVGNSPVNDGYANMIKIYNYGYWTTLTELNPSLLDYYVTCIYQGGESEPSDTLHISIVNTLEIFQHNKIDIFPNPASDRVTIESGNEKIRSLSLINNEGDIVLKMTTDSKRVDLDISGVASSFYILKILTNEGAFTSKLLIVR